MKERIANLTYDLAVLVVVGIAAFGGQVFANNIPLFGNSPVVRRLEVLEQRQDKLESSLDRKLGF